MLINPGLLIPSARFVVRKPYVAPFAESSYSLPLVSGTSLRDNTWGIASGGAAEVIVAPKDDTGPASQAPTLAIALDQGRTGGHCMSVTVTEADDGVPTFFMVRRDFPGATNVSGSAKYLLPTTERANQLSWWMRAPSGYRVTNWASANDENWNVGTYCATADGSGNESNNWHFYHQLQIRWDQIDDEWIHCVVNNAPHHIRSVSGVSMGADPTAEVAAFFSCLTRIYLEDSQYDGDAVTPEISYPYTFLFDDISLDWVIPTLTVTPRILGHSPGDTVNVPSGGTTRVVRLYNSGAAAQQVTLGLGCLSTAFSASLGETTVTVPALGTYDVTLTLGQTTPGPANQSEKRININVVRTADVAADNPSLTESRIEMAGSFAADFGAADASVTGTYVYCEEV